VRRRRFIVAAVVLAIAVGVATLLVVRQPDGDDDPPPLSDGMLRLLAARDILVEPDEAATKASPELAAMAAALALGDESPVAGVTLGQVTHGDRSPARMWVVWIDGVTARCFGGSGCPEIVPGNATSVTFIDARATKFLWSTFF
jgi:hypothetical protein